MKLMSYNIFDGGEDRLDLIISAINKELPDFVSINEANNFSVNDNKILKYVSDKIGLPHYAIAATEWGYDIAVFSKTPFNKTEVLMSGKRAAMSVEINSEFGPLSIVGLHLSPSTEDIRLPEIQLIIDSLKDNKNSIIMGDMNALSRQDNYSLDKIKGFNEKQIKKFTNSGNPHFEVMDLVLKSGYHDSAVYLNKNKDTTVPTPSNKDIAHTDLRLDYVFVSEALL